jgi:hypothetical protein
MNEYEVTCNDGETVIISADTVVEAMETATERGYKVASACYVK